MSCAGRLHKSPGDLEVHPFRRDLVRYNPTSSSVLNRLLHAFRLSGQMHMSPSPPSRLPGGIV